MRSLTNAPERRAIGVWIGTLAAGMLLLALRYDWGTGDDQFAKRGFVLSAYVFVIALPTIYYLARRVLADEKAARAVTAVVFFVTTLPYHLLHLDSLYYYRDRPHVFGTTQFPPSLQFLPDGPLRTFPYDWQFMALLFATGAALIWGVWRLRGRSCVNASRAAPILLTVAFAAICVQTYLHTGMRAPYTYLGHFVNSPEPPRWYHLDHFADGSGASIGDQYAFSPIEDYFQGVHHQGNNMLIRRPLSFYAASQFSFFVNTFYVWIVLNCLSWLVAVLATARLVRRHATQRAAAIAGALVVFGPGFVALVGTPAMYLQYYVATVVALCAFEEIVVRPPEPRIRNFALFSGVLTLCALVYDLGPLILFLLAYGLVWRAPWKPLLASLAAATVMSAGFAVVVTKVLGITIDPQNGSQISDSFDKTFDLLTHPSAVTWYDTTVNSLSSFVSLSLHAFFVLPLLVGLFALRLLKDRREQVFVGGLVLMTLLTMTFLQIGHTTVAYAPRLVYPAFPAIYLLAALALDAGWRRRGSGKRLGVGSDQVRAAAPWVLVGAMAVLVNLDAFGHPTQYVEFFTNAPPVFLP